MTKLKFTTAVSNIASLYNTLLFAKLQFYLIELFTSGQYRNAIAGSCDRLFPNSQKQEY